MKNDKKLKTESGSPPTQMGGPVKTPPKYAGGPAGPIDIEKARDKEIMWKNGLPYLKYAWPIRWGKKLDNFNKGVGGPFMSDQGSYPFILPDLLSMRDLSWPQSGRNSPDRTDPKEENVVTPFSNYKIKAKTEIESPKGKPEKPEAKEKTPPAPAKPQVTTVPFTPPKPAAKIPEAPEQKQAEQKQEQELQKIEKQEPKAGYFPDVISKIKSVYPQTKMIYPQPPTYVWNPVPPGGKVSEEGQDKPLDPRIIKNHLKIKFPDLIWTKKYDGADVSDIQFPDGSRAELAIGLEANHLTITYYSK